MTHIPTRLAQAHATLDLLLEAVLEHPLTYERPQGPEAARTCVSYLREVLDAQSATNPDYAPMAKMAAALVAVHVLDAQAWHTLAQGAMQGGDSPTGTLKGLIALANLVRLIGDDHDLSLDQAALSPKLVAQDSLPSFAPTVVPRTLLEALTAAGLISA